MSGLLSPKISASQRVLQKVGWDAHLIDGFGKLREGSDYLHAIETLLHVLELFGFPLSSPILGFSLTYRDVFSLRERKNIELVIEEQAVRTCSERKDETLVESRLHELMRIRPVSRVHILQVSS